ncbi:fasciclin domain-containing protein [Roseivirga sp. BDSF3-8]|uniref:fasciclin domain-containing protein n=1 Tax=Roseivirga sp. BDSF3-8 TaxID=3241598 RepID=UPI0035321796
MKIPRRIIAGLILPASLFLWSCDGSENQESNENVSEEPAEMEAMEDPEQATIDLGMSTTDKTIADIVVSAEQFSTLAQAVQTAELGEMLSGEGPFTVYAPVNDAFNKLDSGALENLLKPENKDALKRLISFHVVEGKKYLGEMADASDSDTTDMGGVDEAVEGIPASDAQGEPMNVVVTPEGVDVNDADIIQANIETQNGLIHIVNKVLTPPVEEDNQ